MPNFCAFQQSKFINGHLKRKLYWHLSWIFVKVKYALIYLRSRAKVDDLLGVAAPMTHRTRMQYISKLEIFIDIGTDSYGPFHDVKCSGAVVERVFPENLVQNGICMSRCMDIFSTNQTVNEVLFKSLGFYFAYENISPKSFFQYCNLNLIPGCCINHECN